MMMEGKMPKYVLNDVLITQQEIEDRAVEIGKQITADYAGESVVIVGILRGAVMWMCQVIKSIDLDTELDFMVAKSYGAGTKSSGIVQIMKDLESDIEGRNVIIVEDIVDSGTTLHFLLDYFEVRKPKSVKICALLDKPTGRKVDVSADYVGFTAPDVFIVGYGLDVNQLYRNLPYITSVSVVD
jgi:hypoxanthine phosphoribosyltransferase